MQLRFESFSAGPVRQWFQLQGLGWSVKHLEPHPKDVLPVVVPIPCFCCTFSPGMSDHSLALFLRLRSLRPSCHLQLQWYQIMAVKGMVAFPVLRTRKARLCILLESDLML